MAATSRIFGSTHSAGEGQGAHWLSVSDLMAGLMMVFLFIAIALMQDAFKERDRIKEVAVAYQENQVAIYDALVTEFDADLARWDAAIDRNTLAFEFRAPDVLFERGATDLQPNFRIILDDFFPRYMEVLRAFKASVNEIRIEGHTSSRWGGTSSETLAYFNNMALSQGRTRSVLNYVYGNTRDSSDRGWVKSAFAAVGFSSSRLVRNNAGEEDAERSRRVTFRVITNAETQIRRILEDR